MVKALSEMTEEEKVAMGIVAGQPQPIPHDEAHRSVPKGWHDLVKQLVADLEAIDSEFDIWQVKQKFGGLRFYTGGVTEEQDSLIRDAEDKSYTICEFCGKSGYPSEPPGWVNTLCDFHHEENEKSRSAFIKEMYNYG